MKFQFRPKWKEELVVIAEEGSFKLDLAMGVLTAFLPTEDDWPDKAPAWARDLYPVLKEELEAWCAENKAKLVIDSTGVVF
ncbi:hypothetical protein FRD01_22315 [Microvenator marinus]|uniref:Uncharacterized protein n=1 Tax=Microvenator marinus TaxID=2600177 RepID=A0A5B8Y2J0_9DELT|nr:hypothetical protein [Microvenator marinus]QED29919.1 hypothetical protein FRD01_22315 [Microvenator marinus]